MENEDYDPIWKAFIGKEIECNTSRGAFFGYFNTPQKGTNYVSICPHIVGNADGKGVYLETETPIRLTLNLIEDGETFIRPLKKGFLEEKVRSINKQTKKNIIGFSNS